jgi:aminoglycoside phosphotransferase (APT) family kinase protein
VTAPAPDPDALAAALGRRLGGTVRRLHRLSGGASRVTSAFDLEVPGGGTRPLVVQTARSRAQAPRVGMEAALLRAAGEAGVPVPAVVDFGEDDDDLALSWTVVDRLEGETIARKILRDPEWDRARRELAAQCGRALAAVHSIDPGTIDTLPNADPFADPLPWLDSLGEVRPALELGVRWLAAHRPEAGPAVTVHGDFRLGNFVVGPDGLRGVLDWELAHAGDAAEDLGWLCAPAWRFGGSGEVGGFGALDELLAAYSASGGEAITAERVHWWEVYATVKWATICALQASTHLSGAVRSVEHAAIGRRVCESEWDLFCLLGIGPADAAPESVSRSVARAPFGRPTAAELVEAVREYLEAGAMEHGGDGERFQARVARNALAVVERELLLGPEIEAAHARRLRDLGVHSDALLAAGIRAGSYEDDWEPVAAALAASARDQLLVANPSHLPSGAA